MPEAYSRPASGLRFPTGIKVNAQPDALPATRSPFLQNVRRYLDNALVSRPQLSVSTPAPLSGAGPVLSLEPTLGIYKIGSALFYSGAQIDSGYSAGQGCSLTPFRPNASPAAWEYVWDAAKSTKVLPGSPPTVWPTGMPEPSFPALAQIDETIFNGLTIPSGSWTQGGTAGPVSTAGIRLTDTIGGVFSDPLFSPPSEYTLQVGSASQYQRGMWLLIAGSLNLLVSDVFSPIASPLSILTIYYYSGASRTRWRSFHL